MAALKRRANEPGGRQAMRRTVGIAVSYNIVKRDK
jgi:hypothetical protein